MRRRVQWEQVMWGRKWKRTKWSVTSVLYKCRTNQTIIPILIGNWKIEDFYGKDRIAAHHESTAWARTFCHFPVLLCPAAWWRTSESVRPYLYHILYLSKQICKLGRESIDNVERQCEKMKTWSLMYFFQNYLPSKYFTRTFGQ